jgi:TonB family protein
MNKTEAWKTWEGRVVSGKYPLQQWLGGSDHSAVFLTERPGTTSGKAAIKLVEADGPEADREVARLRAVEKLSHPHLISIFEAGRAQVNGTPVVYALMEYAEEDLSQILPQRPLTPGEVSDMLAPMLDGLSYLHGNGLVHGRIKPSNALAVGDQIKLSADSVTPAGEPNPTRRMVGVYDAPETSAGTVSPEGDVWSLGVTIIAALTQKPAAATQGSQGDPGLPGGIPEPFQGIARECLHIDPKRRCSIADIRARLQPAARSMPAEPETTPVAESSGKTRSILIGLALVVVAVMVVWGLMRSRGKETPAQTPEPTTQQSAPATQSVPAPAPVAPQAVQPARNSATPNGAVVRQVMPDIPQSAEHTIRGTIKIVARVEVDASGKVTSAKLKSAGPSRYFADRVLKAAQQWQFDPPEVNGQPAASAWLLTFRLRRGGTQASAQRQTR